MAVYDYYGAERMAFDGTVRSIEWKSPNHGLPLISLTTSTGVNWVQHYRLLLDHKLKVGDHFRKAAGSHDCTINGVVQQCVPYLFVTAQQGAPADRPASASLRQPGG